MNLVRQLKNTQEYKKIEADVEEFVKEQLENYSAGDDP